MKTIDEIISRHRQDFDDREPAEGHFERFSYKLATRLHSGAVKRSIVPYLLRAAVVAILVTLSSLYGYDHLIRPKIYNKMSLGQVSPEYREVENYYVKQVNMMEQEITSLDINNNPEQKQMLQQELKSMDSTYVELQKELKANPNDQRIIKAMIEHYQTKVDVMNYILSQLKQISNESKNSESHETVKL
jgi:hypothetical protein